MGEEEELEEEENIIIPNENMENPEYFRLPAKVSPPFQGGGSSLKRSLSDYHNNGSRPPLPPKKLGRSPSGEIANKVNKFEQLAKKGSPPKDDINKGLWFYKDGLRSPTTPPPRSRSNSLSPSPLGNSTLSLPTSIQVSIKETPSPQPPAAPPASFTNNGQIEPKVITAALASSPKLFQKTERTVNIPAAFVLAPKMTPKSSPAPTPPRTPSPSPPQSTSSLGTNTNCVEQPSRPPRKKTPPVPPPRTNSSLIKKLEIEANNKPISQPLDMSKRVDQNLKLDEILDICADFEKQIQAEQEELKQIAQQKVAEEENNLINQQQNSLQNQDYASIQFGAISFFPSTPPLPAKKGTSPLKSPTNGVNSHQWSPLNTLSPNRIKTNGSLPRERRPQDFNGQGLKPPSSPNGESMFSFESTFNTGLSPQSTLGRQRNIADRSPYENFPLPLRGSQSPRTHIRTILPQSNHTENYLPEISLQTGGGGEDLFSTEKSKEQLYIEAKHVLNSVEPYTTTKRPQDLNGVSPPQTVPRKPPRSKHDPCSNVMRPPSQEAAQRVLIGTHMIGRQRSPEQTMNKNGIQSNVLGYASIERLEVSRKEYQSQLEIVSTLKRQLNDLELKETEEINQLELERSLLNAEFDCETQKISKAKMKIALLRHKETRLSGIYEELQKEFQEKMNEAQSRIATFEEGLQRLEETANFEQPDLAQLTQIKEQLEVERKAFEDLEFHQMVEAAHKETERDELLKEITELEKQVDAHEKQLTEIDKQQKELLKNVRKETEHLEQLRKNLTSTLNKEKEKMKVLEEKLSEVKKHQVANGHPEEFIGETESEDESLNDQLELNSELDARLSRLALLDKTQAEINQISVATETMLQQSPGKFYRISSHNLKLPPHTNGIINFDTLNPIGSATGSLSDIYTQSFYGSSSDLMTNGKSTMMSKSTPGKLKTPKDPESTTSSGNSPDLTIMSRPMSEESSVWDDNESTAEVRRRHNKIQQQRPLTRYLPIRNENFDLRAHIESAGHQIDLCSQVILAPDSCRGYLHKLSGNHQNTSAAVKSFRSKWNKRWFVFDRHKRAIIYYSDKSETKAKGGVYFQSIEEVYVDHLNHVKAPNSKVTFCMKTTERTYFFMAPSPESMRIWVDVIFTGAEGYQEFQQL